MADVKSIYANPLVDTKARDDIEILDEKIRGYIENLQIGNAILTDTDGFTLTTKDGSPLVLENPIYKFDNVVSDVYTTITYTSDKIDYTNAIKEALKNSKKTVCLSKGTFNIYDMRVFYSSDFTLKGFSPNHTTINFTDAPSGVTLLYQAVETQKNITFKDLHFKNFPQRFMFTKCENVTFQNCKFSEFPSTCLSFQYCSNIKFIDCVFENIGTEIVDHTTYGYGVQLQYCTDVLIQGCSFNEVKGNCNIQILRDYDNIIIRNNTITNSVFGGISGWYANQTGDNRPLIIENNLLMNIGFGTPSPNNKLDEYGTVTGVGCAAIYCGSSGNAAYVPNSIIRNNLIIKCREVSIEGSWAFVENNTILYSGVESDIRYTPSRSSIHFRISPSYKEIIRNNTIVTNVDACITTVGGVSSGGDVVIENNYCCQELEEENIHLVNCRLESLIIKDNFCNGDIYIHNNNVAYKHFILDNECKSFTLVYPIVFDSGYVNLRDGCREKDIYFLDYKKAASLSRGNNQELNIGRYGNIRKNLSYSSSGYVLNDDTDYTLWIKFKYCSQAVNRAIQFRANPDSASTAFNSVSCPGTGGERKIKNVILKPDMETDGSFDVLVSNSSNWYEGDSYQALTVDYIKPTLFIKDGDS